MKRILYEYKQNRVEPQFTPLHSKSRLCQLGLLVLQSNTAEDSGSKLIT
jgi:hypothetical protein